MRRSVSTFVNDNRGEGCPRKGAVDVSAALM